MRKQSRIPNNKINVIMRKQNVKKKKMLLVLPLLVIPFLTMAFWALGGGSKKERISESAKGLNLDLPGANLKEDKLLDKLGFYDKAAADSLKLEEWMRNDPYFKRDTTPIDNYPNELEELAAGNKYYQSLNVSPYEKQIGNPEDQILRKLKLLEQEMNKPAPSEKKYAVHEYEQLPEINYTQTSEDPEMKQLEGTLERILDIQHPERVKERSVKNKGAVYAVRKDKGADTLVKGFYSYSDESELQPIEQNAIEAIIASNQIIVNGAVVKFRLLNDIYIKGQLVPKNTMFSGVASLDGERLTVEINSIRSGKSIYPVKLDVYDMDGLPGIYIPGTINRDVAKGSLNNSLSLADISMDPSLKTGAIQAGVGTLKSLIGKKAKLVRVQLKAGYKVLLNNKNQDQ